MWRGLLTAPKQQAVSCLDRMLGLSCLADWRKKWKWQKSNEAKVRDVYKISPKCQTTRTMFLDGWLIPSGQTPDQTLLWTHFRLLHSKPLQNWDIHTLITSPWLPPLSPYLSARTVFSQIIHFISANEFSGPCPWLHLIKTDSTWVQSSLEAHKRPNPVIETQGTRQPSVE